MEKLILEFHKENLFTKYEHAKIYIQVNTILLRKKKQLNS